MWQDCAARAAPHDQKWAAQMKAKARKGGGARIAQTNDADSAE